VIEQEQKACVYRGVLDGVKIIQNQHKRKLVAGQIIYENRRDGILWQRLRRVQQSQRRVGNPFQNSLAGSDQVCPKPVRIIIPFIKRKPGNGLLDPGYELAEQSRFAKPSWTRKEGKAARIFHS
jgi:hypothetical protein